MTRVTIAAAAALMLAACGGQSEGEADQASEKGEAVSGGGSAAAGAAGAVMTPGEWEMTVQVVSMSAPGVPAGAMPPTPATTVRSCLTPEQVGQPSPGFLTATEAGQNRDCTYDNFSTAGGRIQGTVQCTTAEGTMRIAMDGTMSATSYEMTQRMTGEGAAAMEIESRITGRRIGDCPA